MVTKVAITMTAKQLCWEFFYLSKRIDVITHILLRKFVLFILPYEHILSSCWLNQCFWAQCIPNSFQFLSNFIIKTKWKNKMFSCKENNSIWTMVNVAYFLGCSVEVFRLIDILFECSCIYLFGIKILNEVYYIYHLIIIKKNY